MDEVNILNSKLYKALGHLNGSELERFHLFVRSPYFNSNKHIVLLVEQIIKYHRLQESKSLSIHNIYAFVFKNERFNKQKLSDVMTYTLRALDSFFAQQLYEKNELQKSIYNLEALRTHDIEKQFKYNLNKLNDQLNNYPYRDHDYYYVSYLAESELDQYFIKKEFREYNNSIQRKVDNLDLFYLTTKLRNCCEMINRKNILSMEYSLNMLNEVTSYIETNLTKLKNEPAIVIYYHVLKTLTDSENEDHFYELKSLLNLNFSKFKGEEARQLYDYALNYCIKKINKGNTSFLPELLSLYKQLLKTKIIFEGEFLSQWDYKNIVSTALRANEFEWTLDVIESYKNKINPSVKKNAYTYNLASYYYSKGEYRSALKLLQQVEFTDVFYHLGAKSMLLKMYYEMNEIESFYSLTDSFIIYLKRNKLISEYQREVHLNLVKFTRKTFKLKIKFKGLKSPIITKALNKIESDVLQTKAITNLQWLLNRLAELKHN